MIPTKLTYTGDRDALFVLRYVPHSDFTRFLLTIMAPLDGSIVAQLQHLSPVLHNEGNLEGSTSKYIGMEFRVWDTTTINRTQADRYDRLLIGVSPVFGESGLILMRDLAKAFAEHRGWEFGEGKPDVPGYKAMGNLSAA